MTFAFEVDATMERRAANGGDRMILVGVPSASPADPILLG